MGGAAILEEYLKVNQKRFYQFLTKVKTFSIYFKVDSIHVYITYRGLVK